MFMHEVRDHGIRDIVRRAIELIGPGPTFLTVDIDVLDPAYIPGGTGTPEPGGMTPVEMLWAARTAASELELVGADLVEIIPTSVASADPAALLGDRIVREILTGIALGRQPAASAEVATAHIRRIR
jgi:agmatinase